VVGRKVRCFGERVHNRKVVLFGKVVEIVCIEVVLGSDLDRVVVLRALAHNDHKNMVGVVVI